MTLVINNKTIDLMANIFDFSSYTDFLKKTVEESTARRGIHTLLAKAAGCQTSYLSQVFSGKAHLLPDHVAGLSDYLGLKEKEMEYFLMLLLLQRAATPRLRSVLQNKLAQLKSSHLDLSNRISNPVKMTREIEMFYYSSWFWPAIHISTSVPKLQTLKALSESLSLPADKVLACLEQLEKYNLVEHKNGKWLYAGGATHLPKDSVMTELNHTHWRQRALIDIQRKMEPGLHYTSIVSMSESDAEKMRELLAQSITKSRDISDPSRPEKVFCFSMDFFSL